MKLSFIVASLAAFATCGLSIVEPVSAAEPRSVTVQFADLDTAKDAGAATLYRRLMNASASVCRDLQPGKELWRAKLYSDCVHAALSKAIVEVNRPAVTAYAAARGMAPADSTIRIAHNQ